MTALTRVSVELEIAAEALERATAGWPEVGRLANAPELARYASAIEQLTKALVEFQRRSPPELFTH